MSDEIKSPAEEKEKPIKKSQEPAETQPNVDYLDILKSVMSVDWDKQTGQYRGYIVDPKMTVSYQLGRNYQIWRPTEAELYNIADSTVPIISIIQRRKYQVSRNSEYQEWTDDHGWRIVHKDYKNPKYSDPPDSKQKIAYVRNLFERPHSEDLIGSCFADLLNQCVECYLVLDKVPLAYTYDNKKKISGLVCMDATTIRPVLEVVWRYYQNAKRDVRAKSPIDVLENEAKAHKKRIGVDLMKCSWVQYIDNELITGWGNGEMIVGQFNKSSRIIHRGSGYSQTEASILALDAWLKAWGFNVNNFTSGMNLVKGILGILGGTAGQQQVDDLKMQLAAQMRGMQSTGVRFPIIGGLSEKGLQWIRFDPTNHEMGFMEWMDLCTSILCAVFSIDPREINLASRSQAFQGRLVSGNESEYLTQTKDTGLSTLFTHLAQLFSQAIMRIGPEFRDYRFIWTGLEKQASEEEKAKVLGSKKWLSWNEQRNIDNADPKEMKVKLGDMEINIYDEPVEAQQFLLQWAQAISGQQMQEQQMAQEQEMAAQEQEQVQAEQEEQEKQERMDAKKQAQTEKETPEEAKTQEAQEAVKKSIITIKVKKAV